MYLILMNPNDNPNTYLGAICIMELTPWYVTSLTKPTLFPTEKAAEGVIKKLAKGRLEDEFTVMPVELYLSMVDADMDNEWLMQMRQEQMELMEIE